MLSTIKSLVELSRRPPTIAYWAKVVSMSSKAPAANPVKKQQPRGKGKPAGSGKGGGSASDKIQNTLMACLDAPKRKAPRASEEEMARRSEIGRQYVIGKFRRHNEINHDISCKIKMKIFAVKMLPRGTKWKEEALKVTNEGPPLHRKIPLLTPPIPGYKVSDWVRND